jgi:hypothetical protein
MILQYVNIVLIVKRRYQYIKRLLSEPSLADDVITSTYKYTGHSVGQISDEVFLSVRRNVNIDRNSRNDCQIYDLLTAYSEFHDLLDANGRSYGVLILLDIIMIFTNSVPATYFSVVVLKMALFDEGDVITYIKGAGIMCLCLFQLLTFLWLTACCHSTAEEVRNTLVCVHKLLLNPNRQFWTTADLKRLVYLLVNVKVEFNVCGFFSLNLQLLCGSVGVIFTYILVLNELTQ